MTLVASPRQRFARIAPPRPRARQLALTDEVLGVASILVRERVMPGPAAEGDAVHVAVTLVHQIDHLVTWNQQHLANPNKRIRLQVVCAKLGYLLPEIATPDLMIYGEST